MSTPPADADTGPGACGVLPCDEPELLPGCPRCGYGLTGLGVQVRCPECAFDVDRRWRVFGGVLGRRSKAHRDDRLRYVAYAPLITMSGALAAMFLLPAPREARWVLFGALLFAAGVITLVARRSARGFIALGPEGLLVFRSETRKQWYEWEHVGKAAHVAPGKRMSFQYRGTRVDVPVLAIFGFAAMPVDACVRAINEFPRPRADSPEQS